MRAPTTEIESMLACLEDVFRDTRPLVLKAAGAIDSVEKKDGTPVTVLDQQIEEIVFAKMRDAFPLVSVFGEETGYLSDIVGSYWLIDPIDGTSSFIKNIPTFTNMAVYIVDNDAMASIIYNPSTNEMFTAIKGIGAFKNGVRLDLKTTPLPVTALCKGRDVEIITKLLAKKGVTGFVAPDGAGNAFALVADGRAAAKFSLHSKGQIHDYAPGALLVSEAGGAIIPVADDFYSYDSKSFVACHPGLQSVVTEQLEAIKSLES